MSQVQQSSLAPSLVPITVFRDTSGLSPSGLASSEEHETHKAWVGRVKELWNERTDDLLRIRMLEDDWDGLGAQAPNAALVDSAIDLLKILRHEDRAYPPTRVVAGPTGTIVFEWQVEDTYLEAEIVRPFGAEWMLSQPGHPTVHWDTQ
ncbi:MAG: hypothetical protein JSU86_01350 [Phycisphaerales bacterium]|nr:MAG: hypothetical protein JSU86_01350 [Phycisphaerales bacterium]